MHFGTYLVRRGLISPMQFVEAMEQRQACQVPLGELALQNRRLTMRQLFAVLAEQAQTKQAFGRVAVDLGVLSKESLASLLLEQFDRAPPLHEFLVAIGAIDKETVEAELGHYYQELSEPREHASTISEEV